MFFDACALKSRACVKMHCFSVYYNLVGQIINNLF